MISHLAFCLFRELHEIFYVKKYNQNVQNANLWIPYDLQTVPRDQNSEKKTIQGPPYILKFIEISRNYNPKLPFEVQSESPRKSKLRECVSGCS